MLVHTKKHHINKATILCLSEQGYVLRLPETIIKNLAKYQVQNLKLIGKFKKQIQKTFSVEPEEVFAQLNAKYGKASALLKAVRLREGLSQIQFAAAIRVTQGDLSKMEQGKRSIGKEIAQRIGKKFGINPNLLIKI